MSFVVEDGTGLAAANSYASVAEADAYFEDHGNPPEWAELSGQQLTFLAADNSINDTLSRFGYMGVVADMRLEVDGSTEQTSDPFFARVESVAAGKLIVSGVVLVDEDQSSPHTITITVDKEEALRQATQFLDAEYPFRGCQSDFAQALQWPRYNAKYRGWLVDSDEVPQAVKDATCEAALRFVQLGNLLPTQESPGTLDLKRVKVGPIETEKRWKGGQGQAAFLRKIDALLRDLVSDPNRGARG